LRTAQQCIASSARARAGGGRGASERRQWLCGLDIELAACPDTVVHMRCGTGAHKKSSGSVAAGGECHAARLHQRKVGTWQSSSRRRGHVGLLAHRDADGGGIHGALSRAAVEAHVRWAQQ
jgi:hypothetical protein